MAEKSAARLISRLELDTEAGTFLGGQRIRLLEAIALHGSISQAARHVPMSYKAAWDAVDAMNNMAQQPLVARTTGGRQGGGTRLTEYGNRVIAMYHAVEREYQLAVDRLPLQAGGEADTIAGFQQLLRRMSLRTSARNQFACTVCGLREADVEYEVLLRLNAETRLVAVVTRESAELLGLAIGRQVFVLMKASAVSLLAMDASVPEQLNVVSGSVTRVHEGTVNCEVVIDLGDGKNLVVVTTRALVESLGIRVGEAARASFKASSIILSVID